MKLPALERLENLSILVMWEFCGHSSKFIVDLIFKEMYKSLDEFVIQPDLTAEIGALEQNHPIGLQLPYVVFICQ